MKIASIAHVQHSCKQIEYFCKFVLYEITLKLMTFLTHHLGNLDDINDNEFMNNSFYNN